MALNDLGKVAVTFGGTYNPNTVYDRLTVVVANDGQTYGTVVDNVIAIEPGVTDGWQNYWQIVSMRGPRGIGITSIAKTASTGTTDTYTVYYSDGETWNYNVENGKGIQSIELTSQTGNVDTYTITFGNNLTATFSVTNAREIAPGGAAGQVLTKASNADFDVEWASLPAIVDNLTSTSIANPLSANQGRLLDLKKAEVSAITVTLLIANWVQSEDNYTQTINVNGVTADVNTNLIDVAPNPNSFDAYIENDIRAISQGNGTLTFSAGSVPDVNVAVNIKITNI